MGVEYMTAVLRSTDLVVALLAAMLAGGLAIAQQASLTLDAPEEGAEVGDAITLKGTAPERTLIKYTIDWNGTDGSGAKKSGQLTHGQFAAVEGSFEYGEIKLTQPLKQAADDGNTVQELVIKCEAFRGQDKVASAERRVFREGHRQAPLSIGGPSETERITGRVVPLTGSAPPGSTVSYRVTWTAGDQTGVAAEGTIVAQQDGTFEVPVELVPLPQGVREAHYRMECWMQGARATAQSRNINVAPVVAETPLRLIGPTNQQKVQGQFQIIGEAEPNSEVSCEVWWFGQGRDGAQGRIFAQTLVAGPDGGFELPVTVEPPLTGEIEQIDGLKVRLLQAGKEPVEHRLVYNWRMPDDQTTKPGERLPERLHCRILRTAFPDPLLCEWEGRQIELAVNPEMPVTWYDRRLPAHGLEPGSIIEVVLQSSESLEFGVARAISLIEPRPPDDDGFPPPPPGSRVTDGRVLEVNVNEGLIIAQVYTPEGEAPAAIFVDKKTKVHCGPRMVKLGDLHGGSIFDARGRMADGRWVASDITVKN
jgi:hypothetical protein